MIVFYMQKQIAYFGIGYTYPTCRCPVHVIWCLVYV